MNASKIKPRNEGNLAVLETYPVAVTDTSDSSTGLFQSLKVISEGLNTLM